MIRHKKSLLIVAGTLCVALGVVGIFIPVLPTTPFLLLAAVCYARSSRRSYRWLMTNRWFGEYLSNYKRGLGIPWRQRILTLLLLWLTIGYTCGCAISLTWRRVLLIGIATAVTVHIVTIRGQGGVRRHDPAGFHAGTGTPA